MVASFGPGDRVLTKFGEATVQKLEGGTLYFIPDFSKGIVLDVPLSAATRELKLVRPRGFVKRSSTTPVKEDIWMEGSQALHDIDALRFGLVPIESIYGLTLGLEPLRKFALETLPYKSKKPCSRVNVIIGEWGEGKSHAMSVIRKVAYDDGYVVACVDVDGKDVSLSNPKTVLYPILTSLKGKGLSISSPMFDLFKKASSNGHTIINDVRGSARMARLFGAYQSLSRRGLLEDTDYLLDMVLTASGEMTATDIKREIVSITKDRNDQYLPIVPLIGARVDERGIDFVGALVGASLLTKMAGYKGLIITVDEYEVENRFLTTKARDREEGVLEILMNYFANPECQNSESPLSVYFATVSQNDDEVASEDIRDLNRYLMELSSKSGGKKLRLIPFTRWDPQNEDLIALVRTIHYIYCYSYSHNPISDNRMMEMVTAAMARRNLMDSGAIRKIIKTIVFVMDEYYGPPG